MSNKNLVSIVLPVWNGEKYLAQAIKSILGQTHKNLELIIVNDASTDQSLSIIKKFKSLDSRIQVISNSINLKLPESLNIGFRHSKGMWLTWTSDDNILEEDFLALLLSEAENRKAYFVYSDYKLIDEFGKYITMKKTGPSELIFLENNIGPSFLYHRDILQIVGEYDKTKFTYEDYDYWTRIKKSGCQLNYISNIAPYRYRIHKNQLSNRTKTSREYVKFRYNLISELPLKKVKLRAYLSVLHLAIKTRSSIYMILCAIHILIPYPIMGVMVVGSMISRRIKCIK